MYSVTWETGRKLPNCARARKPRRCAGSPLSVMSLHLPTLGIIVSNAIDILSGSLANDALLLVCRYVCAVSPCAGKTSSPTHKPHSSVIANTVRVDVQDEPTVPYQERRILRAERAAYGCELSERFPWNLSFVR